MGLKKHHIVCIPAPAQGHINPMFKLSNLLHSKGFSITFVHTEFNYNKLLESSSSDITALSNLGNFKFETISDGLPPENKRGVLDLPALCHSLSKTLVPKDALRSLLLKLDPINCVIADAQMNPAYHLCKELGIRVLLLYTPSACSVLGYLHFDELVTKGIVPLKDESYLSNGFLDKTINWIPGLKSEVKLKHLPTFIRTTDRDDIMFDYMVESATNVVDARSVVLNTFDDLEDDVLEAIKIKVPNVSTIGPLSMLCEQAGVQRFGSNLWTEDTNYLKWLDKREMKSVIYVNYGSFTTLTMVELEEFALGLANSNQYFLWVIRDGLVSNESRILSKEYLEAIKHRGVISSWCDQEKVLKHPSIGAFLTHCGWNSITESIGEGIPMICWPFFADQQMNCYYACEDWGVGVEIGERDVTRQRIEEVARDMMECEKGKEIREKTTAWKMKAHKATSPGGSSHNNFENIVKWLLEESYCYTS